MNRILLAPALMIVLVTLLVTPAAAAEEPSEELETQLREAQAQLSTLLVERRDARKLCLEQCSVLWRISSRITLREYTNSAARLLEAELDLCKTSADRIAACQKHVEETKRIRELIDERAARRGRVALEELAGRACWLQAQILLADEEPAPESPENRAKIQELLIERRDILWKVVEQYGTMWREHSRASVADYLDSAAVLAEVERKLSKTPAERIAAYERLLESAKSACEVAEALTATGLASKQAEYTCRAARADAAISLYRERVAAGHVEDPNDVHLRQILTDRLQFYRMQIEYASASWNAGSMATDCHAAIVDFARAALDLRHTPAERVAVHDRTVQALKWHEELLDQKARVGTGTADALSFARAERLQAEIDLLRERIRGDYWGPARQGHEIEPPAAELRPVRPSSRFRGPPPVPAPAPAPTPPAPAPAASGPAFDFDPAPLGPVDKEHVGAEYDDEIDSEELELWVRNQLDQENYGLKATVLQAPHHGSNGSCSLRFLQAVEPEWIVVPEGHRHDHPTEDALRRMQLADMNLGHILRTDLGDTTPETRHNEPQGDDSYVFETDGQTITKLLRVSVED